MQRLMRLRTPTTPEWLPEGAAGHANLTADLYYFDGEIVGRTDVFASTADNSSPYDPAAFTENGFGQATAGNVATGFSVEVTAFILAGCTVVIEAVGNNDFTFSTFEHTDWGAQVQVHWGTLTGFMGDYADVAELTLSPNTPRKCAFTIQGANIAFSGNGGAVVTYAGGDPTVPPVNSAFLTSSGPCYVTSITFLPPVADAALPALSALS